MRTGGVKDRNRVTGIKGHWDLLSSLLMKLSRVELRSMMPVMGPTS